MKYVIGSLILSFGVMLVVVVMLAALQMETPDKLMEYLGIAWLVLAIFMYPVAKKIVR